MFILVDSGATGCKWQFVSDTGISQEAVRLEGINFAHQAGNLAEVLSPAAYAELLAAIGRHPTVRAIHFYGAGIIAQAGEKIPAVAQEVDRFLQRYYPDAERTYDSDLLAAARAVCGRESGIAAILGTGSNSCLWDGRRIVKNVHSSGYILGDEGSGVALGRDFMADFLKGLVPPEIADAFRATFPVDYLTVVQQVYRSERPAAYLSSFAPWIMDHYEASPYIQELAETNFRRFIRRCLSQYDLTSHRVGVIGGFAKAYETVLRKVCDAEGVRISSIAHSPMEGLIAYHRYGL